MKIINGIILEIERRTNNFSNESFSKTSASTLFGGVKMAITSNEIVIKDDGWFYYNNIEINKICYSIFKNTKTHLVEVYIGDRIEKNKIYTKQL